ncbi:MAG: glycoside hydrolase family 1 protein [Oscillospiraceae bacterium]|nr:glycoside hydrolase family 1 protein [Oscillospiraceae bacterium]
MHAFRFPEDFRLGVASAATQIEGGDTNNSWYDWCCAGHIKDGSTTLNANDHYHRWQEDLDLMVSMGIRHCRFGVEWSRIEPEEGRFDEAALAHYRTEIEAMVEAGVRPLLTLHHFTNPRWFEAMGAFENPRCVELYLRFAEKVVRAVGDLVGEYITINEPNVYTLNGYFGGGWPPGKNSLGAYRTVLTHMTACHIAGYQMLHRVRREMGYDDTRVSFANHLRVFQPYNKLVPLHRFFAWFAEKAFQGGISRAMCLGEQVFPLKAHPMIQKGRWCDFHAINYYSRSTISGLKDGVSPNVPVNDLGWEIYPDGIAEVCRKLHDITPLDIYITENGTCDNTDTFRSRYIYEHLKALSESDLPIKRYYHWCFCDNFEWLEGESARFGLVHIDYSTQQRTVKESGKFYSEMIAQHGVSEELYEQYCRQDYHTAEEKL